MSTIKTVHLERFIVCSKFNTRDITQPHRETPANIAHKSMNKMSNTYLLVKRKISTTEEK